MKWLMQALFIYEKVLLVLNVWKSRKKEPLLLLWRLNLRCPTYFSCLGTISTASNALETSVSSCHHTTVVFSFFLPSLANPSLFQVLIQCCQKQRGKPLILIDQAGKIVQAAAYYWRYNSVIGRHFCALLQALQILWTPLVVLKLFSLFIVLITTSYKLL